MRGKLFFTLLTLLNVSFVDGQQLFSYQLGEEVFTSSRSSDKIRTTVSAIDTIQGDAHAVISFFNVSADTLTLHNIIPFTRQNSEAYITGIGRHELSRTHLVLPGRTPVNVIVPDNAWDLGFNITMEGSRKLAGLTRRTKNSLEKGARKRFETILYPGGSVKYDFYISEYTGKWQKGMTKVFQEKKLYDTAVFNDSLFLRKDLQWIRHAYVMHLMDAWDKYYYDYTKNRYTPEVKL